MALRGFLEWTLTTQAARDLSWVPFRDALLADYNQHLGEQHLVTALFRQEFLPAMCRLYSEEKKEQKERMDARKEELMAYAWHPDRFLSWCLDEEEKAENRMLFA